MPTTRPPDPASALASIVVLLVILAIHGWLARRAVADLGREDVETRAGTKRTWFVVIVLGAIVGPLAWFAIGRQERG